MCGSVCGVGGISRGLSTNRSMPALRAQSLPSFLPGAEDRWLCASSPWSGANSQYWRPSTSTNKASCYLSLTHPNTIGP